MELEEDYVQGLLRPGKTYMIFRNEYRGKVFYKTQITKKNYDKTNITGYLPITFRKGIDLPDRTIIVVKKAMENFYLKGYDMICTYTISEFEETENVELQRDQALASFQNNLAENENADLSTTQDMGDVELPF